MKFSMGKRYTFRLVWGKSPVPRLGASSRWLKMHTCWKGLLLDWLADRQKEPATPRTTGIFHGEP
jgi:hypothetical protein